MVIEIPLNFAPGKIKGGFITPLKYL